ncbi:MAG TPA: alpha/beta hydrolase-fold protein [Longimicrobium sp.]
MHREHHRWHSPSLDRDMDLLVFGHAGARVLVFPTSMGRYYEWEDRRMTEVLGDHLRNGWLQLYCVDSVDEESWYARRKHPIDRARRHQQFEDYVLREVLPLSWQKNPNPFLMATGASFGAYHAVDIAFRHPHLFGRVLGMSGLYDISQFADGHMDANVYGHNPSHFVQHLGHEHLEGLRRMDIILATGHDDPNVDNVKYLSRTLWDKGVGNALRLWDGWSHDWPYWERMLRQYIGGSD